MKNTIFKSFKFTFSLMLTVMLCLSFSTITNAASVKRILFLNHLNLLFH